MIGIGILLYNFKFTGTTGGGGGSDGWILYTGSWDDTGTWIDTDTWKDS